VGVARKPWEGPVLSKYCPTIWPLSLTPKCHIRPLVIGAVGHSRGAGGRLVSGSALFDHHFVKLHATCVLLGRFTSPPH
jgi:hypothetical protein